ncbi:MAG TPA: magnesium transporter [Acidimicrobiia bacterium]|nr:magnesium transporter [Acidimicrobiia bacterium]
MRLRLRSPRQLAKVLINAARRDREEVADYLDSRRVQWEALAGAAPGDAADVLEQLTEQDAAELLTDLSATDAADILEQISPELAAELVEDVSIEDLTAAVTEMTGEAAADLLFELDDEVTESVLSLMDDESEQEIRRLLVYPQDSAGGLMTTDIALLPIGLTAGEAIERIRNLNDELEDLSYVYVVDDEGRLQGVISFRDLVFKRPGASLDEAMVPDPVSVNAFSDREEVAELAQRYHLFGIPVTDGNGRLLGMVTSDAVLEAVQDEATEDFAAAVGAGVGETVYTDVSKSVRMRSPWLILNLGLSLVVALVIEKQTGIISQEPILAALMPVVASLGGNSGNQALAVMIRSLASDDVPRAQVPSILKRHFGTGLFNGVILAVVAAGLTYLLLGFAIFGTEADVRTMAIIVAVASLANLVIATLAGATIPLVLRRLGQDPALASSILLTTITDVVGFGGFLLVATALLS